MAAPDNKPGRRWSWVPGLLTLAILPGLAMARFGGSHDLTWPLIAAVAVSAFAFIVQAADKGRAAAGEWRISESALHLLELIGGWPGAFVAQQWLRHKNAKVGYQIVFWLIVGLHQLVALDYLLGWRILLLVRTMGG
jgi:uncharacterized membrane protein YsdA (DUF1294 family)